MQPKCDSQETVLDRDFPVRTAEIGFVNIVSVSSAAIIQFGDRGEYTPTLTALAVQREESHATAGQVYFESYSIFSRPLPVLQDPAFDTYESVSIARSNSTPRISVGCIIITAVGSSASLQAGNAMRTMAVSRIKHIRQYKKTKMTPGIC
ncbi:spore germination protein GerPE [Paenibacillus sp. NEAU-GSW1]|uniref:spore germination protein GerPE n=1 Tax=Paenibacillus sp. NEAU-GSW1 TaxID=2682486 RepID=UPI0012E246A9|nr:spore germination protein GerPE [Paenibacillus sp. NEAU-GSW1]MUT66714.1 spore germination protein GerPE [Paenibacillus sp. NEAU-GSW1]